MNISVYAPWREYRARIFKIQSREYVSTAWKERAIQRKANSQTPAILNVGPHSAQWRCSSLFKLFHFSSRPFSPSLSYSSTKYSPTWSRNLSAKFHPSLQQRCMPNKHPRLTSQSRIYIPRIPGWEESAVEEASVTSSPLTIVVKINSLPLAILPLHRELLSSVFPSSIVTAYSPLARLKISPTLPNFDRTHRVLIKIKMERRSNDSSVILGLVSCQYIARCTSFWNLRLREIKIWRYEEFFLGYWNVNVKTDYSDEFIFEVGMILGSFLFLFSFFLSFSFFFRNELDYYDCRLKTRNYLILCTLSTSGRNKWRSIPVVLRFGINRKKEKRKKREKMRGEE